MLLLVVPSTWFPDTENVGLADRIVLLSCLEADILRFLSYFRLMAAILISVWDTMIIPTSLTSSWVALPVGETCMKKFQPVRR